jgi:hypothetical protein
MFVNGIAFAQVNEMRKVHGLLRDWTPIRL